MITAAAELVPFLAPASKQEETFLKKFSTPVSPASRRFSGILPMRVRKSLRAKVWSRERGRVGKEPVVVFVKGALGLIVEEEGEEEIVEVRALTDVERRIDFEVQEDFGFLSGERVVADGCNVKVTAVDTAVAAAWDWWIVRVVVNAKSIA